MSGEKITFRGRPMTFHESLHWCGCDSCRLEIQWRAQNEPPLKAEFKAYLAAQYPETAGLWAEAAQPDDTQPGIAAGDEPSPQPADTKVEAAACGCNRCVQEAVDADGGNPMDARLIRMFLCETCGNKRCPHAADHRNTCTNSNEPGQPGSSYP